MNKIIIFFFLIFSVLELNAQKIEPKYSFNVELGLPVTIANTPFNDVMQGLLGVSLYQQYSFPFHLNVGLGARYSLFTINEFRVPVPLNGSVHTTGAFVKVGYDKFITDRFAIDFGVKVGYTLNFTNTKEGNLEGDIINTTNLQNESLLIEPTLGLILSADEKTSFRFTIGYNIQGYGFSPRFIGLESDSNWDPNKYSTATQYLIVGFGFTYYFRKREIMFLSKNDLPALKAYFTNNLPEFSSTEINTMVKTVVVNRLKISSIDYMVSRDLLFSESDLLYFRSVLKRLQNEEPFQHIVGEVEFYGLELKSDDRALIPRPETEELVDWIISDFDTQKNITLLDLCGGSGCIALALKSVLKNAEVSCGEWSDKALQLISENSLKTSLNVKSLKMDVLNVESYQNLVKNSFNCWVSNPPYIPQDDKKMMAKNVLDFEPDMALFVENDAPFVFYEMIAKQGQQFLKENGCLYFEIHESYGAEVIDILRDNNFVNIELRKDLQGRDRMIKAQKLSSQNESERS